MELYKPYYWWVGLILVSLISLPALFIGGVLAYLITLIFVGVPLVLLGVGGLRQQETYVDYFFSTVTEALEGGSYKDRSVNIGRDSYIGLYYGLRVSPPYIEMSLYGIKRIPIKARFYWYFAKGVIVYNGKLKIFCYRYIRRRINKETVIKLLDKLSSIANIIEEKYRK